MANQKNRAFERFKQAFNFVLNLQNIPTDRDYMGGRVRDGVYLLRMRWFLDLLGNPDRGFKYIHITGTSGKGTVTQMVHNMLLASQKKVGSFKSPFVTSAIELVQVNDRYISPEDFADSVEYLKPFIDRACLESPYGPPSYFELMCIIAFLYFRKEKCEWVVLEVGLGGRFDSTNIIEHPVVTAVTSIDYDHTEILGKTLTKIARDKGGIIKKGSSFFTSESRPHLLALFKDICKKEQVPCVIIPRQHDYRESNRLLATAIGQYIGINEASIVKGIQETRLPCRFEVVQKKPLVVLDGAHNQAKMRSTAENIKRCSYRKLRLVIGTKASKDSQGILESIVPLADHIYITRFELATTKCTPPKELFEAALKLRKRGSTVELLLDPEKALQNALKAAGPHDCVLVTGSFYLAGQLRVSWYPEERILHTRKSFS